MSTIATVVPGYQASVSPPWRVSGVFTRSLSSFSGDKREAAHAAGFRAVANQLAHTDNLAGNLHEMSLLRGEYRARGWFIVGWGTFGQDSDPEADGWDAAKMVKAQALDGWIANGEAWAEGLGAWKSAAFMKGWRDLGGSGPLMLSCLSSVTGNFGRSMDYPPFLAYPQLAVSPQCYSATQPLYTIPAMQSSFKKATVPLKRLMPTCDVVEGKPIPTRYKRWRGPRWLWTGETTPVNGFARVLVA